MMILSKRLILPIVFLLGVSTSAFSKEQEHFRYPMNSSRWFQFRQGIFTACKSISLFDLTPDLKQHRYDLNRGDRNFSEALNWIKNKCNDNLNLVPPAGTGKAEIPNRFVSLYCTDVVPRTDSTSQSNEDEATILIIPFSSEVFGSSATYDGGELMKLIQKE